jgi:hypothetical protein
VFDQSSGGVALAMTVHPLLGPPEQAVEAAAGKSVEIGVVDTKPLELLTAEAIYQLWSSRM